MPAIQNLIKANLGWLFYKKSYSAIDFSEGRNEAESKIREKDNKVKFEDFNETIVTRKYFSEHSNCSKLHLEAALQFDPMKILYPGLLTGSGYTHETGKLGEFKIGYFFDYTTGLPVLPGHSVKGCLRSCFPQYHNGNAIAHQAEKQHFIMHFLDDENIGGAGVYCEIRFQEHLKSLNIVESKPLYSKKLFIEILEKNIFDGLMPLEENGLWKKDSKENLMYKPMGIYERDIFFDAYPVSGDSVGLFLATDSITPHPDPFVNPNPLLFLKLRSGVQIQFQFSCKDGILYKYQKLKLFRHLLCTTGIGAKTNVGYGQFEKDRLTVLKKIEFRDDTTGIK